MSVAAQTASSRLVKSYSELQTMGLQPLLPFHNAYIIVANNLFSYINSGEVQNIVLLTKLEDGFVNYYLGAIDHFVQIGQMPTVWQPVLQSTGKPKYLQLILGANAHINHDLVLALAQLGHEDLDRLEHDYFCVDAVLYDCASEILDSMYRQGMLNGWGYHTQLLYRQAVMQTIIHWRHQAWHKAHELLVGNISTQSVAVATTANAKKLMKLAL